MARKLCTICNLRPVGSGRDAGFEEESFCREQGYCLPCGNEGQHEISHDNGHEGIPTNECWICNPEMNEALADYKPRTGHTNTVAKTRGSHAGCTHERTPRARANCRKARLTLGAGVWTDYAYNARCTCAGTDLGKILIHSHTCPMEPRHAA